MATATASAGGNAAASSSASTALYTCLSCSIAYHTPEDQRAHYQTDLHRYNMKRRVASLPPVRADVFNAKVMESKRQAEEQAAAASGSRGAVNASRVARAVHASQQSSPIDLSLTSLGATRSGSGKCQTCNKSFASAGALESHLNSRKHKDALAAGSAKSIATAGSDMPKLADGDLIVRLPAQSPLNEMGAVAAALPEVSEEPARSEATPRAVAASADLRVAEDATEEEIAAAIDAKVASSKRIDPTKSCIFCKASDFASLDESLQHMSSVHSFFVPEQEYLVDKAGLLQYLSDKICIGNICLYCNGVGRGFASADAVRKHMIDKSHCKIAYEAEEDKMELSDFYDFTSSYPDAQWEDVSDAGSNDANEIVTDSDDDASDDGTTLPAGNGEVRFGDNEFELVLPSGVRLGHRSMRRYYNQALRPTGSAYADLRESDSGNTGRALAHRLTTQQRGGMRLHVQDDPKHDQTLVTGRNGQVIKARSRGEAREAKKHINTYRDAQRRQHFMTQVGYKNNSQKHFRDEMLQ